MDDLDLAPGPSDELPLLQAYRDRAQTADELFDQDGRLRPVWAPFLDHLTRLGPEALAARIGRGDQYLRDAGVYYRKYDTSGPSERDWPLRHIPVMIASEDWEEISAGLIQRADLLEAVLQDIYGPNTLVADGHLPPSLVAQSPGWLRPLVGVQPRGGHFLNFVAFEVGRGPNGRWWVLGDRTEAPSGAGFALENRATTSRIFSNYYAKGKVLPLSGFFRSFQAALETQKLSPEEQIAILTPGAMNDVYFEHAFIARHLGLLLAEGEDLTLRKGRVMVRTVDGLKPVSVLWRRQDAISCDPIELDDRSQLGTPGLVEAVRQGHLHLVNALGSGVLETRAFLSFLPKISEAVLGEPLLLPNIATWWCGQSAERDHVLEHSQSMLIGSAYSTRLPFDAEDGTSLGAAYRNTAQEALRDLLKRDGRDLVGQEAVTLSTTPVWDQGELVPRPMILRVFLARGQDGWTVMPGGYARIGSGSDNAAISMQQGGSVADVWVQRAPGQRAKPAPKVRATTRHADEALPSRAADNLFWLGRYVERAEGYMRLFRAYHSRFAEDMSHDQPLLREMKAVFSPNTDHSPAAMARSFEAPLEAALDSAGRVRDRFSVDGMMALQDLGRSAKQMSEQQFPLEEIPSKVSILLHKITGFSGLVHENMFRTTGWRFLSIGISLERAANTAALLAAMAHDTGSEGALDLVLEVGDSTIAHRMRYSGAATAASVTDLLALDEQNPRAIMYHLSRSKTHIAHLPGRADSGHLSPLARLVLKLHTRLAVETPGTLSSGKLLGLRKGIWRLSDLMSSAYLN